MNMLRKRPGQCFVVINIYLYYYDLVQLDYLS